MKIIIEQKAGIDYPLEAKGDTVFISMLEGTLRQALKLRKSDTIEFREVD